MTFGVTIKRFSDAPFLSIINLEKFTLINKDRSRIKVFEPFEDVSKPSLALMQWWLVMAAFIKGGKPVMQGSRVETIESARKEYAELLKEGWKKTSIFGVIFNGIFKRALA